MRRFGVHRLNPPVSHRSRRRLLLRAALRFPRGCSANEFGFRFLDATEFHSKHSMTKLIYSFGGEGVVWAAA